MGTTTTKVVLACFVFTDFILVSYRNISMKQQEKGWG